MKNDLPPAYRLLADRRFYLVLLAALLVRGAVGYVSLGRLAHDPDSYRLLAINLIEKRSFTLEDPAEPTAYRPALYPLLLAITSPSGEIKPAEVAALHLVMGVLTVAIVYAWAVAMGYPKWAWLAAMLTAIDPVLLNQAMVVMTETLGTLLAAAALLALTTLSTTLISDAQRYQKNMVVQAINVAGAIMLAVYSRPTFLVWLAMCTVVLPFFYYRQSRGLAAAAVISMISAFLLAPWVARNYLIFDNHIVLGTTHGGYTLLWGNNPEFYEFLRKGDEPVWNSDELHARFNREHPKQQTSINEWRRDRAAYAEAKETIRQQPGMFAWSTLVRVGRFWRLAPHALSADESTSRRLARYAVGAFYLVEFALALVGVFAVGRKLWSPPWLWGVLLAVSFTLVHAFFWSNIRMRAPVVPVICLLATAGFAQLVSRQKEAQTDAS
ncbi:hypothetical protein LOC68_18195 [Blastopirellula sp. JC732]|uniref:Glycosyltransferase RgtA/B/C/D-like domain-containing protein n=1 Tax=Blastopirellula sediminis TaxID=2894196 RepID=A0A9X1MQ55_9BACT|nr:hypothetical protein [Blastopirellula sediminis]MCC9606372.1 hypothetical protein [Blastopirellula sediminis]MCC9630330.1 hypothetical protein [Blastopirellula sediminis]